MALIARAGPLSLVEPGQAAADPRTLSELRLGFDARTGALRAGTMQQTSAGYFYPGPRQVRSRSTPLLIANTAVQLGSAIAAGLETSTNDAGVSLRAAYLNWAWRAVNGWVGRRPIGFGAGPGDGLVLNQRTPFTGAGVALRDGVAVPVLGRLYADIAVARMRRSGSVRHPWFQATRLTLAPHDNIAIALNRAAIFGGTGDNSITPVRVALMLLGFPDVSGKDSDFENQVASIEVLWRTALSGWPLALHTEYGADDSGYAFLHVPAIITGIELVRVPGAESIGLGVEAIHFSRRCCTYPAWYRHGALGDGWTDRGRLLGHPLAGDGTELAMTIDWIGSAGQPLIDLRLFQRHRGSDNLFAPDRTGDSLGADLRVIVPVRGFQFELRADGEAWTAHRAGGLRLLGSRRF